MQSLGALRSILPVRIWENSNSKIELATLNVRTPSESGLLDAETGGRSTSRTMPACRRFRRMSRQKRSENESHQPGARLPNSRENTTAKIPGVASWDFKRGILESPVFDKIDL